MPDPRLRAAAQHGIVAHELLATARELRSAARSLRAICNDHRTSERLLQIARNLDARRRREMGRPADRDRCDQDELPLF